jgi:hypothetical protein
VLVAAAGALAGCGGAAAPPDLALGIAADWSTGSGTPDQIGFYFYVVAEQKPKSDGTCHALPASLQITALEQPVPLVLDSNGCLQSKLAIGPFLQPPATATITVEQDGKMVGEVVTSALTPGAGATLVSPPDGIVHPGDEVIVAPTPGLPANEITSGELYFLDGPPPPGSGSFTGVPTRLADGVHAKMPAFSGRVALVFKASPFYIVNPMLTCDGVAICTSIASDVLGPVIVTGAM